MSDLPPDIPPPVIQMLHSLLGCAWGHTLAIPDDMEPCIAQAVQIVVLHDGDDEQAVKLCAKHVALITELTDPHE